MGLINNLQFLAFPHLNRHYQNLTDSVFITIPLANSIHIYLFMFVLLSWKKTPSFNFDVHFSLKTYSETMDFLDDIFLLGSLLI